MHVGSVKCKSWMNFNFRILNFKISEVGYGVTGPEMEDYQRLFKLLPVRLKQPNV